MNAGNDERPTEGRAFECTRRRWSARLDKSSVGDGCPMGGPDTHNPASNPDCYYAPSGARETNMAVD